MIKDFKVINILDMEEAIGEENLKEFLSDFSCPRNEEIQNFVRDNAYEFARKKLSVTYLVVNEKNGFMPFNERYSETDGVKYIQLFNFF